MFFLESKQALSEPRRPMSTSGSNYTSQNGSAQYSRLDLQSAFNWLIHQPEHIRKQATDPDRLMSLFYRSSGQAAGHRVENRTHRAEPAREPIRNENERIETEAPVSGQSFISDLRQINEAMRQFDGPQQNPIQIPVAVPIGTQSPLSNSLGNATSAAPASPALHAKTLSLIAEVREKLNLGSDAEAINLLVSVGAKSIRPLLG